jgi:hypothetical protein
MLKWKFFYEKDKIQELSNIQKICSWNFKKYMLIISSAPAISDTKQALNCPLSTIP